MKWTLVLLALLGLAIVPAAHAQGAAGAAAAVEPDSLLKHWLRNLVVAQEKYFSEHGTYTTELSVLGMNAKPRSVNMTVVQAGGRSWWGLATALSSGSAPGRREKSCVIWVGTSTDFTAPPATARKTQARDEGAPACDPS